MPVTGLSNAPLADPEPADAAEATAAPPATTAEGATATTADDARAALRSMGIDPDSFVAESDGTLYAPLDQSEEALDLPRLSADELKRTGLLGRGGQGMVERAEQRALGREVAVKRVTGPAGTREASTRALVHEARVAGHLEHPGVVPVHALGLDEDGDVVLVMKRIEGESWEQRIKRDADVDAHLRILAEVTQAVAFAHDKGIVHRDLKPSNVMLGSHGEVYVLDWGLAVAVDDTAPDDVTRQLTTARVTGTPAYMPPEMATPGGKISRQCDVYLLGGMLYRLLAGRAPHQHQDVVESVLLAQKGAVPPLPDTVDPELKSIVAKALAPVAAERFASAEAFAAALEGYQSHAFGRQLTERALERVALLLPLVEGDAATDAALDGRAARLFHEARFSFEQALEQSPEYPPAQEGKARALTAMMERELLRGRADAAALLAEELDAVPEALAARLLEARRERDALAERATQADALEQATDVTAGQHIRAAAAVVYGIAWMVMQLIVAQLVHRDVFVPSALDFALTHVVFLSGVVVVLVAFRRQVIANAVGRQIGLLAVLALVSLIATWVVLSALGIDVTRGLSVAHVAIFLAFGCVSTIDWRWWVASLLSLASVPLLLAWPRYAFEINGVAIGVGFIVLGALTLRRPTPAGLRPDPAALDKA
jgi:hypothetical protein